MVKKREKRQQLQCVQARPPACPKCGCTDRTKKTSIVTREINGVTVEGQKFTKVQWNYANCKNCNQRYKFMEYLYPVSRTGEKG